MKFKRILYLLLSLSLITPTFAVDTTQEATSGGDYAVPLHLRINPPVFSVTLPTSLPVEVSAAGEVTKADNAVITNNSDDAIEISNVRVQMADGWSLKSYGSECKSNEVSLKLNDIISTDGGFDWTTIYLEPSKDLSLEYDVGFYQTRDSVDIEVGQIIFTVGWAPEVSPVEWFVIDGSGLCDGLSSAGYDAVHAGITELVLPSNITALDVGAFNSKYPGTSTGTRTDQYEIDAYNSLTSIEINEGCVTLSQGSVSCLANLTYLYIPNTVTSINQYGLTHNVSLESLTIPSSVTSIGMKALEGCNVLEEIIIHKPEGSISGAPWSAPNSPIINWLG